MAGLYDDDDNHDKYIFRFEYKTWNYRTQVKRFQLT